MMKTPRLVFTTEHLQPSHPSAHLEKKTFLFSTNFCLPVPQNLACTMASPKEPLKADSQSWKEIYSSTLNAVWKFYSQAVK